MKKRVKLDSEEVIYTEIDSPAVRKAIISLFRKTDSRLTLLVEEVKNPSVFLLVGYNSDTGTIEYQVSDGMDCHRSMSFDFYNIKEAIKCFDKVCDEGWRCMKRGG